MYQKLMTKEILDKLPPLYSQEKVEDPIAWVKFFTPWTNRTWYGTEYDPKQQLFFGWVEADDNELGYFSLKEMEAIRGPWGLRIERDMHFDPKPLSVIKAGRGNYSYTLTAEEKIRGRKTSAKRLKVPSRRKKSSPSGFGGVR